MWILAIWEEYLGEKATESGRKRQKDFWDTQYKHYLCHIYLWQVNPNLSDISVSIFVYTICCIGYNVVNFYILAPIYHLVCITQWRSYLYYSYFIDGEMKFRKIILFLQSYTCLQSMSFWSFSPTARQSRLLEVFSKYLQGAFRKIQRLWRTRDFSEGSDCIPYI